MESIITIENMEFYAYHGCFTEEQAIGTHFFVNVEFTQDSTLAVRTDNIEDTVNYLSVYQSIKKEMNTNSRLIEHLAHRVLLRLFKDFSEIQTANITIKKMNPPLGGKMQHVAVTMKLNREEIAISN